jgi:hypothetical protein
MQYDARVRAHMMGTAFLPSAQLETLIKVGVKGQDECKPVPRPLGEPLMGVRGGGGPLQLQDATLRMHLERLQQVCTVA